MPKTDGAKILINLAGDVMIGRLIDQLLPTHVYNAEEAQIIERFRQQRSSHLSHLEKDKYHYETIWGDTLPLWKQGNVNVINLETSMTTHEHLWPRKVFNYRSHPANVACLSSANIHHVSLANNHTLDFNVNGLEETCETLRKVRISFVGAGQTREEALGPTFVDVPIRDVHSSISSIRIGFLSVSDHPSDWSSIPSFHFLPSYTDPPVRKHLARLISDARSQSDLVIFSIHWGPNYRWIPDEKIQQLARWMIEQGVDIIHGHSSHHLQGLQVIERKDQTIGLILYGCGDFVDDYAVEEEYRNDLGALFRVHLTISSSTDEKKRKHVCLDHVSIYPTRCSHFQVNRLSSTNSDWKWIREKLVELSDVGERVWTVGDEGEFILELSH